MADKMMRIAGKTSSDTACGIAVTSDGNVKQNHVWEQHNERIVNEIPEDTSAVTIGIETPIVLADYAVTSLRFYNNTGVDVRVRFLLDTVADSALYLRDADGNNIEITIPSNASYVVSITPNDIPVLNYLNRLKFTYACKETPTNTSGSSTTFRVWVVSKQ